MLPDRVSNPGPLTYESGALPIALRGPARSFVGTYRKLLSKTGDPFIYVYLHYILFQGIPKRYLLKTSDPLIG